MPAKDQHEKKFFTALNDIFIGAKIEGESGFINLMAIKSHYYEKGVFPLLTRDIDSALAPFPEFREELFDKLYTFFQRYFSESGSIYFRYTVLHQNIYEKVYTDDRDVILFWKTHMLYYVKTDRIFRSVNVEVDGSRFFFDASKMMLKKANEKRVVVYTFRKIQAEDSTIVFDVDYSEKGRTTKIDEILKECKIAGKPLTVDLLSQAFRVFEKQSEVDFFINKDARAFLQEQFDLWMYQYLFAGQNVWSAERLAQLQVLKVIAYKVISFISQFEDELVKVWNKPKFVLNSHYFLTLDKLIETPVFEKILNHPNLPKQVNEWQDLGMLDDNFSLDMLTEKDLTGEMVKRQYKHLPIDTKYFPDIELDFLAIFDNLDEELDGWLIHSENYQALNTLHNKYRGKVKCIYIDPPYNTAASEIIYQNQFKHSSWFSLLSDRLQISKNLLSDDGILCVAIDDVEAVAIKNLGSSVFGNDNYLSTIVIRSNPHGRAMAAGISQNHEYSIFYSKTNTAIVGRLPRNEKKQERYPETDELGAFTWINFRKTGLGSTRNDRPRLYYPVYVSENGTVRVPSFEWSEIDHKWTTKMVPESNETAVFPMDENGNERVWNMGWERAQKETSTILIGRNTKKVIQIYRKYRPNEGGALPSSWWDDPKYSATESGTRIIKDLFGDRESFSFPKSVYLVEDCLRTADSYYDSLVIDYFAGSGTTAHAVMNLNRSDGGRRKYILVEMGEHFNTVILPRIKKVAFSDQWKDGKVKNGKGMSHFVKYYDLEQYEDVLKRAKYDDATLFENPNTDPYHSYVFLRDLKMLESLEFDSDNNQVHFHPDRLYPDPNKPTGTSVDMAETLSQRTGKWIKRITAEFVEFQDGERISLKDPDWQTIKPLVWWQ